MRTLIVLVLIVSPILVASNYTTCVQGIFDYEDAYARMKLNLMGICTLII